MSEETTPVSLLANVLDVKVPFDCSLSPFPMLAWHFRGTIFSCFEPYTYVLGKDDTA